MIELGKTKTMTTEHLDQCNKFGGWLTVVYKLSAGVKIGDSQIVNWLLTDTKPVLSDLCSATLVRRPHRELSSDAASDNNPSEQAKAAPRN